MVSIDGLHYDLSPLASYKSNGISNPFIANFTSYLSICDGPITGSNTTCDGAYACEVTGPKPTDYAATLGTHPVLFTIESDTLVGTYSKVLPFIVKVFFLCQADAGIGQPRLVSIGASQIEYSYQWPSSYGCPVGIVV